MLESWSLILRSPAAVAAIAMESDDVHPDVQKKIADSGLTRNDLARAALVGLILGGAVFGLAVGSYTGLAQSLVSGIKIPAVVLVTLSLSVPAFYAMLCAIGRRPTLSQVVTLALVAATRSAMVLLAFAPALWLAIDMGSGYHQTSTFAGLLYGAAGVGALSVLFHGVGQGSGRLLAMLGFVSIYLVAGTQTAWASRPFVGRPTAKFTWFRAMEGSALDALTTSLQSSGGRYRRDHAPVPDHLRVQSSWSPSVDRGGFAPVGSIPYGGATPYGDPVRADAAVAAEVVQLHNDGPPNQSSDALRGDL